MAGKISNKKYKEAEATRLFTDDPDAIPKARKDIFNLLVLLMLSAAIYFSAVILIDPYKVFNIIDFNKRNFELSARYNSVEFLKKNPKQGFIFGTSRANGLPTDVASSLTGLDFYNMASPGDSYKATYQKVKWVLENQPAKNIIIALDHAHAFDTIPSEIKRLIAREHPEVSGESRLSFYWAFLWGHPKVFAYTVHGNLIRKGTWWWWDRQTGHYHFLEIERALKETPKRLLEKRVEVTKSQLSRSYQNRGSVNRKRNVEWISKAVELAQRRGVKTAVILNPSYPGLIALTGEQSNVDWRRFVMENVDEVWDFAAHNGATCDDMNWFDTSHYAFSLGKVFLNKVFAMQNDRASHNRAVQTGAKPKNNISVSSNIC